MRPPEGDAAGYNALKLVAIAIGHEFAAQGMTKVTFCSRSNTWRAPVKSVTQQTCWLQATHGWSGHARNQAPWTHGMGTQPRSQATGCTAWSDEQLAAAILEPCYTDRRMCTACSERTSSLGFQSTGNAVESLVSGMLGRAPSPVVPLGIGRRQSYGPPEMRGRLEKVMCWQKK